MKKIIALLLCGALALAAAACGTESGGEQNQTGGSNTQNTSLKSAEIDETDLNINWQSENYTNINLSDNEGDLSIAQPGVYRLTGSLTSGGVTVETSGEVWLILDGVYISNQNGAPISITASRAVLTLAEGSRNTLIDGGEYQQDENGDPSAALFSQNDLTINGSGALSIASELYNGIQCKDVLKIVGGSFTVNAGGDGIKGRDALIITGGSFDITASDGLNSNNDNGTGWGYISISGGYFNITAADDGVQAVSALLISGGELEIIAGGGAGEVITANDSFDPRRQDFGQTGDSDSASKGLRCDGGIEISGGTLTVNSADDALHSNSSIKISSGTIVLSSGDDGIHADAEITIDGGSISVLQSYEGIEAATITINGGNIDVYSSDDGLNASDGSDTSGQTGFGWQENGSCTITINGGYLYVSAGGDGLDANGSIYITGGETYVDGPTNSANGAIDSYNGLFVSGGTLVAAGAMGMAETLDNSSAQAGAMISATGTAGSELTLTDEGGNILISFTPQKGYSSVVVSCPEMAVGETYHLYSGSTLLASLEQSSISVSSNGSMGTAGGNVPGGFGRP